MRSDAYYPDGAAKLLESANAWRRAGRLAEARSTYAEAAAAAEVSGDVSCLVDAALGLGGLWVSEHRDMIARAEADAIWKRAVAATEPGTLPAARLAVRLAAESVYDGTGQSSDVQEAVAALRVFDDPGATAEALALLHHVLLGPTDAENRVPLAGEVITLATLAGDPVLASMGLCWRTVDLFLLGDRRAGQSLEEFRERTSAGPCEALAFVVELLDTMLLARSGDLAGAEDSATRALAKGIEAGDPDAPAYYGAMLAALRLWQGRSQEILGLVRQISRSPRLGINDHVYVAADAVLSASERDFDSAEEALARLTEVGLTHLPPSSSWLTTQALVVEAAWLLGDPEPARQASALLAPFADLPVMPSLAVVCFGSVRRALGLAAALDERPDDAVGELERAVLADRRIGNRPMAILTEHSLAAVLRWRAGSGDADRADELARRAASRARRIGLVLPDQPQWLSRRDKQRGHSVGLERSGRGWRICVDGRVSVLADRVGLGYLERLTANPGRELDVFELLPSGHPQAGPSGDPLVDGEALHNYRRRMAELQAALDGPRPRPISRSEERRLRGELTALSEAVRTATGLGGRARTFPTDQERARTAVRKALLRALELVAAAEPELAAHLTSAITTGVTCRYAPSPEWRWGK